MESYIAAIAIIQGSMAGLVIERSRVRLRPRHYSGNNPGQVVHT